MTPSYAISKLHSPTSTLSGATTEEDQLIAIEDADAYCGWPTRKVFLAAKNLKWIHCAGTGIDGIMKIPELIETRHPCHQLP